MAFPASLDNLTDPQSTDRLNSPSHSALHQAENAAIEALEAKVGVDSSIVVTSLDYIVKNASSSNPGHKHTFATGATDVTATAAEVNVLNGITSSTAELNILTGVTASAAELNYTDIATPGTAQATKALVTSAGNDINLGVGDIAATIGTFVSLSAPLPQGTMINGQFVTSVASNNITLALKGLNGNDPSTTNPVYVRIGNNIRTVTAALSITRNAGTNWFNSGATEYATREIDYFIYLGYNATDGVTIGFSRIPFARQYADFVPTTTGEKHCAINTIVNVTNGDIYENVGRFNAILSGTAAFNWSIPATSIIINRPIIQTRELAYSATGTGFASTSVNLGSYIITGKSIHARLRYVGVSNTTGFTVTAPFSNNSIQRTMCVMYAVDNGIDTEGLVEIIEGTRLFTIYRVLSAAAGSPPTTTNGWTNSGSKAINLNTDYII